MCELPISVVVKMIMFILDMIQDCVQWKHSTGEKANCVKNRIEHSLKYGECHKCLCRIMAKRVKGPGGYPEVPARVDGNCR